MVRGRCCLLVAEQYSSIEEAWEQGNVVRQQIIGMLNKGVLTAAGERFRFWDEDDYENEIFPILSGEPARTNVILAGKCRSRRQSTTSFSKNVVVAKTSYQLLEIL